LDDDLLLQYGLLVGKVGRVMCKPVFAAEENRTKRELYGVQKRPEYLFLLGDDVVCMIL